MQPREHGRRYSSGREDSDPRGNLEARKELAQGRKVRERRGALFPRDGEPAQFTRLDVSRYGIPAEHDWYLSREQGEGCRAAALVRHVNELDAGACFEHFHGEMMLAAVADRSVGERRLGAARVLQEIQQVLHRQRGVAREHHLGRDERGYGREILQRIDRQVRVQMRADDDLAVLPQEQRVSVGRGPCGEFAREVAVGARAILDHHRLPERLAEPGGDHAGNRIGGTARRIGHEQANRPARVLRPSRCCTQGQKEHRDDP